MTRSAWNKGSGDTFLQKAIAAHGTAYDYSKSEYKDYHTKVLINCPKHGEFWQKPAHHCAGIGCPSCGKEKAALKLRESTEDFVRRAISVHGSRYDYSKTVYKNSTTKVRINCPIHGEWEINPRSHLSGCGCTGCAGYGFSVSKPGYLYVLQYEDVVKVGVTNRAVSARLKEIRKSSGKSFVPLTDFYFEDGKHCLKVETNILRHLREKYSAEKNTYNGSTECFYGVDKVWLLSLIEEEINHYVPI